MKEENDGVKIERLPTVGKPLSLKGTKWRPLGLEVKVSKEKKEKILRIKKLLESPNEEKK